MIDEFSKYHPFINFIYFLLVILYGMFFIHPISVLISFLGALIYLISLEGIKKTLKKLKYSIPLVILTGIINPLFNHEGATIIYYFRSGNPLTLEAIFYGIGASFILITIILWFMSYNMVMTEDKFIYLFGKVIPSLALVLSMALRFVPKFTRQLNIVVNSQKAIGRTMEDKSLINKVKVAIAIFSIMVTWALESAIQTADSMKSRGYGLRKRTSFSIYKFTKRDKNALIFILILGLYILIGSFRGTMSFRYYPTIKSEKITPYSLSVWLSYFILLLTPVIINKKEEIRWNYTQLKI